ncbi:MAG: HD domain-containing protein [Myxococcota bacterium]
MAMSPEDRARLALAAELAAAWHAGQTRKGTDIPYVSHLLQVAGSVLEHGGDVDQAIAGLLHDALEDAGSAAERAARETALRERFGGDVLEIVLACTDTGADESAADKRPWKQRKTRFLDALAEAPERALLVVGCDKRHNLHALVWDLEIHGPGYLERFNAGPADQVWYFARVRAALEGRVPERLYRECLALEERFVELVAQAEPRDAAEPSDEAGPAAAD